MTTTSSHYVTLLWEARANPGKEAEMKSFITAQVTASRHDAGNIEYEAHEVEGQPGAFIIFERWESREALEGHLQAPRVQELVVSKLLELMEGTVEDGIRILQPIRPAR